MNTYANRQSASLSLRAFICVCGGKGGGGGVHS